MAKITEDKTLTPAEQHRLRVFVQEVWTTANYDDTGVTDKLGEQAEVAAEILGFELFKHNTVYLEDDDDDAVPE